MSARVSSDMRRSFSIGLLLLLPLITWSQSEKRFIKSANKLFEAGAYAESAAIYLILLQQHYQDDLNRNLAVCLEQMGDHKAAEYWYEKYLTVHPEDMPALLSYAHLLKYNGKYHLAKEAYLLYATADPVGYYFAGTCDYAINNQDRTNTCFIEGLGINTPGSDISPAFINRGIMFSSNGDLGVEGKKQENDPGSGSPFYSLYYVSEENTNYQASVQPLRDINQQYNNAAVSYDQMLDRIFITRNNYLHGRLIKDKDRMVQLSIMEGLIDGLSVYKLRPFEWNDKTYSVGQPFVLPGGDLLLFVSDMPGGFGGTDIYYCINTGDGWSEPINMGAPVNTPGNEMYPFLSDQQILYFSSDYLPGFGGLDIFMSARDGQHWSKPVNMGLPLNSSQDDFGLILTKGSGYFCSNRPGGAGNDDIYRVAFLKPVADLNVINARLQPVADALVVLYENDHRVMEAETDLSGHVTLPVEEGHQYSVHISKDGYMESVVDFLDQYRSTTGSMEVSLLEYYDYIDESEWEYDIPGNSGGEQDTADNEQGRDEHDSEQHDGMLTYELFIGSFEDPDYTRITSLARFGELSVRQTGRSVLEFYIINLDHETALKAHEAAIAAGFQTSRVITYRNKERID